MNNTEDVKPCSQQRMVSLRLAEALASMQRSYNQVRRPGVIGIIEQGLEDILFEAENACAEMEGREDEG